MVGKYAAQTEVSSEKSRAEIERILARFGADSFFYGWEGQKALLGFRIDSRMVRITLPLPDRSSREITHTPNRRLPRTAHQQQEAYEQAVRQRWRSLALIIKAKLVAIEDGISTVEREFLADIVLPSGLTFGEWAHPQLEEAYRTGQMPPMLPA